MSPQLALLTYVWHYVIARVVYDVLGVVVAATLIAALLRARRR